MESGMSATRAEVFAAIERERDHQEEAWGSIEDHPLEVSGYILVARAELREAEEAWATTAGDEGALRELLQVAAVIVAALEEHGVFERQRKAVAA